MTIPLNVSYYKYLGINLDPNRNFSRHIAGIKSSLSHKIYMLTKVGHMMTRRAASSLYKSMILLYLDFGDTIYGGTPQNNLTMPQRLQNRCRRIICNYNSASPLTTFEMHKVTKTPFLWQRRRTRLLSLMFRRKIDPLYLDNRQTTTRQHQGPVFKVQRTKMSSFKNSIYYRGAIEWNGLDLASRNIATYEQFKYLQKRVILSELQNL